MSLTLFTFVQVIISHNLSSNSTFILLVSRPWLIGFHLLYKSWSSHVVRYLWSVTVGELHGRMLLKILMVRCFDFPQETWPSFNLHLDWNWHMLWTNHDLSIPCWAFPKSLIIIFTSHTTFTRKIVLSINLLY